MNFLNIKNKKISLLLILLIVIFMLLIGLFIESIALNTSDKNSPVSTIKRMITASYEGDDKTYISCFIPEYQASLNMYKKYNKTMPLMDYKFVNLMRIKEISKDYFRKELQEHSIPTLLYNTLDTKKIKTFYIEAKTQTERKIKVSKINDIYNGVSYFLINIMKENGEWKIISVGSPYMDEVIYDERIRFYCKDERAFEKKQNRMLINARWHTSPRPMNFDYRNLPIPTFNNKKSVLYNCLYKDMLHNGVTTEIASYIGDDKVGKIYYIKDANKSVELIKEFDKLYCEMPTDKYYKYRFLMKPKYRITNIAPGLDDYNYYDIYEYKNELYLYSIYGVHPPIKLPDKLIKLFVNNTI